MVTVKDDLSLSNEEWDEFVGLHSSGTFFHKSSWLDILAKTRSVTVRKIGFYENGFLIGVLPLFVKDYFFFRVFASPLVVEDTPYMGLVVEKSKFCEVVESFCTYMEKNRPYYLRILQQDDIGNLLQASGNNLFKRHTHVLDLTRSEAAIFDGFEGRCRTAIRKAVKSDVKIVKNDNPEIIESYYAILESIYSRQKKTTPNPKNFYYLLWGAFARTSLHMLTAWHGQKLIAGAIILHDKDRCYYLNGASLFEYNNLCPNNLIQWEAIRLAKSLGATRYDFVGSDIERLSKFKKSFGGNLETYSMFEKSSSSFITFMRNKYPLFKMVIGKIYLFFSKIKINNLKL